MGCHILDPVFSVARPDRAHARSAPRAARRTPIAGGSTRRCATSSPARSTRPRRSPSTGTTATSGPPPRSRRCIGERALHDQGSIYIGTEGVLYSPYIADPVLLPAEKFKDYKLPQAGRATTTTSSSSRPAAATARPRRPFDYSGPLTESVLLGCLATRFPETTLEWDAADLKVTNVREANRFVRREYRKGWESEGL